MKTLQQAEADGVAYAEHVGVSSIKELRAIAPDKLPLGMGMGGGWPIVDSYVIPDDQYKLYEAGKFNDTPILVGYNSDEGASFMRLKEPEAYYASVRERYGIFADSLIAAYPAGDTTVPKTARDLARDAAFGWQTWSWARLQAKKGTSKAYLYYFDQHPGSTGDYGSPHGMDVGYVFMHLDTAKGKTTPSDHEISEAMGTYWTNFAKYGDPNGEGVPEWPAFSDESPDVMYFGPTPHIGPVPSTESLKVLDEYFKWRRSPEGAAWVVE
jgi:para-nitrobenzyl esterase